MTRTITIIVKDDGTVQGDLDDTIALWPHGATEAEAMTIDGQSRSILSQALIHILRDDLLGMSRANISKKLGAEADCG